MVFLGGYNYPDDGALQNEHEAVRHGPASRKEQQQLLLPRRKRERRDDACNHTPSSSPPTIRAKTTAPAHINRRPITLMMK